MPEQTARDDILDELTDALTSQGLTELLEQLLGDAPSLRTLERWRTRGSGPPYILCAGRVRYLRRDVADWLNARRRRSTSAPIWSDASQ